MGDNEEGGVIHYTRRKNVHVQRLYCNWDNIEKYNLMFIDLKERINFIRPKSCG